MSSIDVSFDSSICSDVTNASTAETFFVSFTLPSSFAFAWFVTGFSEDFLAVPDFQAIQFSIFTFHRFVTSSIKVAIFITQSSHFHWSKTAGTAVDNCHNVSLHLRIIWDQMLLRCQLFFQVCAAHRDKNCQSHVLRQLVSSAFSMALFQNFSVLDGVRQVVYVDSLRGDKICLLSSRLLPVANGLWLHQPDARSRIDNTAECNPFLMHRLVACRNSLYPFLQFMDHLLGRHGNANVSCV